MVWHDLITPDLAKAKDFYGGLFGRTFQDQDGYSLALLGGKPVAGLAAAPKTKKAEKDSWWLVYISANDVDQASRIIKEAGGKIIKEPAEMDGRGRFLHGGDLGAQNQGQGAMIMKKAAYLILSLTVGALLLFGAGCSSTSYTGYASPAHR